MSWIKWEIERIKAHTRQIRQIREEFDNECLILDATDIINGLHKGDDDGDN